MADGLTVAAEIAAILEVATKAAPPRDGGRGASRASRERAYSGFQRAATELALHAEQMPVLLQIMPGPTQRLTPMAPLLAEAIFPARAVGLGRRLANVAQHRIAVDMIGDLAREQTALREMDATRDAVARFLGALGDIRLAGTTKPRVAAENVTALLGELFATVPLVRPAKALRHLPVSHSQEVAWQKQREYFEDCRAALGEAHKDFVLTARDDLGRGRAWWQRGKVDRARWWQLWRPRPWPGSWPGPNARELIARVKADASRPRPVDRTRRP